MDSRHRVGLQQQVQELSAGMMLQEQRLLSPPQQQLHQCQGRVQQRCLYPPQPAQQQVGPTACRIHVVAAGWLEQQQSQAALSTDVSWPAKPKRLTVARWRLAAATTLCCWRGQPRRSTGSLPTQMLLLVVGFW